MQNQQGNNQLAPLERLLRDLRALGGLGPDHVHVRERLRAELGNGLYVVLEAELEGFDADAFPLSGHTRRVA